MKKIITIINCVKPIMKTKHFKQLKIIIYALLTIRGRITMLGLSRWSEKGGSYSTIKRFFNAKIDWLSINWIIIKSHLIKKDSIYILAGDEVIVKKSGKKTYGLSRFYSSIDNKVVKSIGFLHLTLIDVNKRKAYPLSTQQILKDNKDGCKKDQTKKKKNITRNKVGRPKGSGNKDKKNIDLSKYLLFIKKSINTVLKRINGDINIKYFVFDGEFGYNGALQMVDQTGLKLISKLQKNSALYYPYKGEQKRRGVPKIYGDKIDYNNLDDKYLKDTKTENNIKTNIYQMEILHKKFPDKLNVVIIQKINLKNKRIGHVILFTSDLDLEYNKIIDYYSLRFQIEFVFRDAKQYWGLEDYMNVKEEAVNNSANLSTFMVNISHILKKDFDNEETSVLDIKASYHGIKYVNEVFKLLPEYPDDILIKKIFQEIGSIGAIHNSKMVA